MKPKLFRPSEKELLLKIGKSNDNELLSWQLPNFIFPIIVIVFSMVCFYLFKPDDKFTWIANFNILVNGSLPILALTRMSSVGIHLFRFNREKEKLFDTDTTNLRIKIDEYSKYLIVGIIMLYIYQVIKMPFVFGWGFVIQLIISVIFIYFALVLSKYAYLLQERMVQNTFDEDITTGVRNLKKSIE